VGPGRKAKGRERGNLGPQRCLLGVQEDARPSACAKLAARARMTKDSANFVTPWTPSSSLSGEYLAANVR